MGMNAKISKYVANWLVAEPRNRARKGRGSADNGATFLIHGYPGKRLSIRVLTIKPIKPALVRQRRQELSEKPDEGKPVAFEIRSPNQSLHVPISVRIHASAANTHVLRLPLNRSK